MSSKWDWEMIIVQKSEASKIHVTLQNCSFAHFEATLDFSRSEFTWPY